MQLLLDIFNYAYMLMGSAGILYAICSKDDHPHPYSVKSKCTWDDYARQTQSNNTVINEKKDEK